MNRLPVTFALLLSLSLLSSTAAQYKSSDADVRINQSPGFSPARGGFEVQFPDKPNEQPGLIQVAGKVVTAYQYSTRRPDYGVIYFEVPESLSAAQTVGLLKGLANTLMTEKNGSIVIDKDYSVQGKPGRMLEIKAANGVATYALFLVADSRIYRVTATVPREAAPDKLEAANQAAVKFLESFTIVPSKRAQEDSRYLVKEEGDVDRFLKSDSVKGEKPIDYGHLEGRAIKSPAPRLPDKKPYGSFYERVVVKVVIDESGRVVAAQVVSGHPDFRSVSLFAARQARFEPPLVDGKPVKILGTITYAFYH